MALDLDQIFANAPTVEDPPKKPWELAFEKHFNVQPTSAPVVSQPNKAQLLLQPYLDKGLDPTMAIEAANHFRTNQVNSAVNVGLDMVNHNPIGALTMDSDKFHKRVQELGVFGTDDIAGEAESEIRRTVPLKMGDDWFKRQYGIKDNTVSVASDVNDEIGEQLTKDAYDYSNKFLSEADRKMADLNLQIKAEKEKTTEDGYDAGKVKSLYLQLSSLGKTYTDENGDVIDAAKATPEQKEYMKTVDNNVIELTKLKETEGGEKRLKDSYFEQYKFVRALDELYDEDVDPWLQQQIKAQANPSGLAPAVAVMPKAMKQIIEQRRSATAQLAALSKLYLANTSPANVKKNFKYYAQSAAKGFVSGLIGKGAVSALQDELGPTERDMLDAAQSIMNSKGLDVSPETQKTFDRSVGEYAVEGGSQVIGMLPVMAVAGGIVNAGSEAIGLSKVLASWAGGERAVAAGLTKMPGYVDKSNEYTRIAATFADMAIEEIKLSGLLGFAPGTGSGFVVAGKISPNFKFKNPWAQLIANAITKPLSITSGMYLARGTEAAVEATHSYKDFSDILTEKMGTGKEFIGTLIGNFPFAFGGAKAASPDSYKEMLDHSKELRSQGKEKEAIWVEQQVNAYKKMDKAAGIAYRKGKYEGLTEDQIVEKMKAAESEAAGKAAAATQVTLEQQNLLERTIPPERLSIVMKGSKMRDAEGNLQVYWHGTDRVFNRFSKVGNKTSTGGKANSRSGRLTFFSENPEMAKSFGSNTERRYLNFKKPIEVGNVRKLNDAKIADLEKQGYDGITGWETINGKKEKVAAAFGTQGIVKAEELLPFKSKNAETLRSWADQLRNKELRLPHITQGGLPISFAKFEKRGTEAMAKVLEISGDVIEVIEKGFATIQETGWYKKMTPELRAKFDPEIRARLQKLLEESRPEAVAKYDLERATKMETEVKDKYLPEFTKQGEAIAKDLDGKFISDVKKPESTVAKKKREGLSDVLEVQDAVRGVLVVKDLSEFKAAAKKLKEQGYSISNKRVPNKETGYRGITATKREGELGSEIQIHTEQTWENQQKAQALWNKHRDAGIVPNISKVKPPESYYNVDGVPKEGSVDLSSPDKPDGGKFSEPHGTYEESNGAAVHSKAKNLWVKTDGGKDNSKRILMTQFTSDLMGVESEKTNKASEYYASIYKNVPGYNRAKDFWEIPQWQAEVAGSFKNADSYVVRDINEAKQFIERSGYKEVAFSVLDVTKDKVKALAEALPEVRFNVGGYINMGEYFKDNPNVKIFDSVEAMAADHGVKYVPGYDYRHFVGTPVIPRLTMSTGCKYNCTFCTVSADNPFKSVDSKTIMDHVEQIKKLKAPLVYLNDKTFGQAESFATLPKAYEELKKDNPDFQGFIIQTTPKDFADIKRFTPEYLAASGIKFVELGVETRNDVILKDLKKTHSQTKYTDAAMENARENGVKVIPNLIIGFEQETKVSYENTLKWLNDNKDIISHANIYSLAVYEKTGISNDLEVRVDADRNENVVEKSFHTNPELHKEYYDKFLAAAQKIVEVNGPKMQKEQDMEKSRQLYDEAYSGLEDINLEGSPAKTPLEKKMKAMEIPITTQKELNKAWTETKQKLMDAVRAANSLTPKSKIDAGFPVESVKDQFKAFVKDMPLTGLGVPLRKAMLNKVNSIDFTKPKSLEKAITYFDKIINDATFRLQAVEYFKGLTTLDQKTSDLDIKVNGILKAKAGPDYLPTREHLEGIRKNMLEADYNKAQTEIEAIYDKYRTENGINEISPEDLQKIEDLSFHGLLNATNQASLPELKGVVRSLKDIIKLGKAEAAARRYIRKAQEVEFRQNVFNIIDGKPGKPVELDPRMAANIKTSAYTDAARKFDWVQLDSFFTLLDKLSKFDKNSDPYQSILNKELGGSVLQADLETYKESHELYNMIQNKAKEVFGSKSNWRLRRDSHARTKTLHTIEFTEMGTDKSITITENQAYKKYMEFQDPSLEKANEAGGYMRDGQLTELGEKVVGVMSESSKKWADWQLNEFYPMMYEMINPKYKELYGRDMPMGEKYSPIFVEGKGNEMAENDILAQQHLLNTATNASLKTRVAHANPLRLMDGDKVLLNYVDKMIYFKNWSDAINLLNNTFVKDQNIKTAIQQNFGDKYNQVAKNFIDEFARQPKNLNTYIEVFEKIRNNFAISSLAVKPTVFFAQITAIPAYLEKVPTLAYANEFRKFLTDPKGSWDILQEIRKDSFWQQRYGEGWDRDVIAAMREDLHSLGGSTWQHWKNQTMFLTKYGDMAAVVMGGLPMYRHVYNTAIKKYGPGSERQAKAEAMAAFAQATRESQQAGQSYDLSVMQRANSFTKLLTMYKTSPFQYHRKVVGAVRNMSHGRGDVSGNLKTIAIYHVILPQLFQIVGNGFRWDKDDQLRALGFGNINEIFVAGDIMKGITNTLQGLPFDYQMTPVESTWKSAQKGAGHLQKANIKAIFDATEEVNMDEIYKAITDLGNTVGDVTGTPVHGISGMVKGVKDVATGNTNFPVQRILGYSEKAIEGGRGFFDSSESEDQVTTLMNDTKKPSLKKILEMNKPLPTQTKKPLPGGKSKPLPTQKVKQLPKK